MGLVRRSKPWLVLKSTGVPRDKKTTPPKDSRRALGMGLLKGPRRGLFRMSEVPL